jgi:hypothetical protein
VETKFDFMLVRRFARRRQAAPTKVQPLHSDRLCLGLSYGEAHARSEAGVTRAPGFLAPGEKRRTLARSQGAIKHHSGAACPSAVRRNCPAGRTQSESVLACAVSAEPPHAVEYGPSGTQRSTERGGCLLQADLHFSLTSRLIAHKMTVRHEGEDKMAWKCAVVALRRGLVGSLERAHRTNSHANAPSASAGDWVMFATTECD